MRTFTILIGSLAVLTAIPASAQLGGVVGGGGTLGGAVNGTVNTTARIDTAPVLDNAGRIVNRTEQAAVRTVRSTNVTLVTREQVRTGLIVRDERGQRIGTVSRVSGDQALVVSGNRMYQVPLAALYRHSTGAATNLVSSIPRAQLTAKVNARASTKSSVSSGN